MSRRPSVGLAATTGLKIGLAADAASSAFKDWFRVYGLRAEGSGFPGSGIRVRVQGLGFRVWRFRGLGFRVPRNCLVGSGFAWSDPYMVALKTVLGVLFFRVPMVTPNHKP